MNKLDIVDANFQGTANLNEIFEYLGKLETFSEEVLDSDSKTSELRTTSVRLPPYLVSALDAVLSHHKISRNDAFLYMVYDFISSAIVSYSIGQISSMNLNTKDLQTIIDTCENLIYNITDDEDIRKNLLSISNAQMKKTMGVL